MDTRDHSGATARMLAKQYGHMKIVGLLDAHSASLPKSLYRSPGAWARPVLASSLPPWLLGSCGDPPQPPASPRLRGATTLTGPP